jgi:hypothetical protein
MPRLTAEFFGADLARGLGQLGNVTGAIAGDMAHRQAMAAAAKAEAEAKIRDAEQTTMASELLTNAATALTQNETELRGTADHTNYLEQWDKRAEHIRKSFSKAGTDAGLAQIHGLKTSSQSVRATRPQ